MSFSKNLVQLRKERGLSQKRVAADLNISQALLSHYEKGIRECGLDFVLRTARYFDVSCDFLLGNILEQAQKPKDELRSPEEKNLADTLSIVFGILKKINSKTLTKEIVNYLYCAVYTIIRLISGSSSELFKLDEGMYSAQANAKMTICRAKARAVLQGEELKEKQAQLDEQWIAGQYPGKLPALQELTRRGEKD